jgi:hypothetical protein
MTRPIAEAHRLGMKILIKPHLAYWGSPFKWRGDITFSTTDEWQLFFNSYREWIVQIAEVCRDADGFVVGTELDRTLVHEPFWREIIAGVRSKTDAPLTYAANWTDYERVAFWDALDAIGIQAYFPVYDRPGAPDTAVLRATWVALAQRLATYSRAQGRPVVFTELGYNRSAEAAQKPWSSASGGPEAALIQQRCLDVALETLARTPEIHGAFLWKWFVGPAPGENFDLTSAATRRLLASHWLGPR